MEIDLRKKKRQRKIKITNYYRGAFYGKSSASLMYQLCSQLNLDNKDMLWYYIIGMTH